MQTGCTCWLRLGDGGLAGSVCADAYWTGEGRHPAEQSGGAPCKGRRLRLWREQRAGHCSKWHGRQQQRARWYGCQRRLQVQVLL